MMNTSTVAATFVHTCTYLGSKISGALQGILTEAGLGQLSLKYDWDDVEGALRQWLGEQSLKDVILEIFEPGSDVAAARFDVDISYVGGEPTTAFRNDLTTSRIAARKAAIKAGGDLRFRVVLNLKDGHSPRTGWSSTKPRGTGTMSVRVMGELAAGPGATSHLRFWVNH
jgi:hypothetical protein